MSASSTPPSILYVIGSLQIGGAEQQMLLLIQALAQQGWSCSVFALDAAGPLRACLEELAVPVEDGGYRSILSDGRPPARIRRILYLMRAFARLLLCMYRKKSQIVHSYLPLANLMGSLAGRLAGVPCIITSRRALNKHQDRRPWWRYCDKISAYWSHAIIANAPAVAEDTFLREQTPPYKMHVIPNGLDPSPFRPHGPCAKSPKKNQAGLHIVHVANLIPYKGHSDLIDALAIVSTHTQAFHYYSIGQDRGILSTLQEKVAALGLQKQISFLGQRRDMASWLWTMDLALLSSHEEGCSNALLEAMAAGLPIIATAVGGNVDLLQHGDYGCLVPAKDPKAMAEAIVELINHPEKRAYYQALSLQRIQDYSLNRMVEAHIALYQQAGQRASL